MTASDMHTRAMLAKLSIRAWSARKYDRKITAETNEAHGATSDAGRYNKMLLPGDAPTYKALCQHISALRLTHYAQSLAWSDEGWRLLPVKNYQNYTDALRTGQHEFNRLLSEFLADYPALRSEARARLNGMYNDEDYPSDLASKYDFAIEFAPVPCGSDFRVTLSDEEIAVIAARTEERVKQAFADAHIDACKRLYDAVARIRERLTGIDVCSNCDGKGITIETRKRPDKGQTVTCWICDGKGQTESTFRDSLITNARELCDVLTRLNVANDAKLDTLRHEVELLATAEPQTLRDVPQVRNDTAERAETILAAMRATYGGAVIA